MRISLWIIAVCAVIRIIQNGIQLMAIHNEKDMRANAYEEYIKSLHQSDAEYLRGIVKIVGKMDAPDAKEDPDGKVD